MQYFLLRRRTFIAILFGLLFIAITVFPTYKAGAQSADSIERAIQSCSENGGSWNQAEVRCDYGGECQLSDSFLGIPTWYKYLETETDSTGKCNVILRGGDVEGKANSALPIGIAVLEAVLRLAGLVAVVMIFWGGFKYIISRGNPDSAKGARTTLFNAIIGLVIVIVSTALISFIGRSVS